MAEEHKIPKSSANPELKEPGLRGVKTTNAFKIVNFELFVKPVSSMFSDRYNFGQ